MARFRKIDITLTLFSVRAIYKDGTVKNFQGSLVGKYSEKEVLKNFNKVHMHCVFSEIESIDYLKNHYEIDLGDLYVFCENNAK